MKKSLIGSLCLSLLVLLATGVLLRIQTPRSERSQPTVAGATAFEADRAGASLKPTASIATSLERPRPTDSAKKSRPQAEAGAPLSRPALLSAFAQVQQLSSVRRAGSGGPVRVRVWQTDFKYPFLRTVDSASSGITEVMVADQVLARRKEAVGEEEFLSGLGAIGIGLEQVLAGGRHYVLRLASHRPDAVPEAIAAIAALGVADYSEPNRVFATAATTTNDPRFTTNPTDTGKLWGLARMQVPEGWDLERGEASVIVAVVDTGYDSDHPDFDFPVVAPYDFYNEDDSPEDDNGHGTHVTGTIAATDNNSLGVVGICHEVSIMPLKITGSQGVTSGAATFQAFSHARVNGAKVINCSFGANSTFGFSLADAVDELETAGVLLVCGAGNDGGSGVINPAGFGNDNIISVAATTTGDALASFSNYHPDRVDLAAPGVAIWSTMNNGSFAKLNGTSMATPHVTATAALLWAHTPSLSCGEVREAILGSADYSSALADKVATEGRVNTYEALRALSNPLPVIDSIAIDDDESGSSSGDGNGLLNLGETIEFHLTLRNAGLAPASNLRATLVSLDPGLVVLQDSAEFGDPDPGASTSADGSFVVSVSGGSTPRNARLRLELTDDSGSWSRHFSQDVFSVGSQLSGKVRLDGIPTAGVTITYSGVQSGSTASQADGLYGIPSLIDGDYDISASAPGWISPEPLTAALPPGKFDADFDFTTFTVSGSITDAENAAPLSGATVTLGGPLNATTTTDTNGAYSLSFVAGKEVVARLSVRRPGTHLPSATRSLVFSSATTALVEDFILSPGHYLLSELGTLPGGSTSDALDLNDSFQIVGTSERADLEYRAFLWEPGSGMIPLADPAVSLRSTGAAGINEGGTIVGTYAGDDYQSHGLRWSGGPPALLAESANVLRTDPRAINSAGHIVGTARDTGSFEDYVFTHDGTLMTAPGITGSARDLNEAGQHVGVVWVDFDRHAFSHQGALSDLHPAGYNESAALAVNAEGSIAGWLNDDNGQHAALYRDGAWILLPALATSDHDGQATALNDAGVVVGHGVTDSYEEEAFLFEDGQLTELNHALPENSPWSLHRATAINNHGAIVGQGSKDGQWLAYLLEKAPRLLVDPVQVEEVAGLATVQVRLSHPLSRPVSIDYATEDLAISDAAQEGGDYTPVGGTLTWSAGDSSPKSIAIPLVTDATVEGTEEFGLHFSQPVHAILIQDLLPISILDGIQAPSGFRIEIGP